MFLCGGNELKTRTKTQSFNLAQWRQMFSMFMSMLLQSWSLSFRSQMFRLQLNELPWKWSGCVWLTLTRILRVCLWKHSSVWSNHRLCGDFKNLQFSLETLFCYFSEKSERTFHFKKKTWVESFYNKLDLNQDTFS